LAVLDFGAELCAGIGGGVAVASQVHFWGLAIAKFVEESYVYVSVSPCGTCFGEGTLVAVLAPVDGYATGMRGSSKSEEEEGKKKRKSMRVFALSHFCKGEFSFCFLPFGVL